MSSNLTAIIMHLNNTKFVHSAATERQLLPDQGVEVAFIGRSNAGKSSAINCITGVKKLAHSSKTPGRTQLINFFHVEDACYLVDLPGYGYAKIAQAVQARIQMVLSHYLQQRKSLKAVILVMDSRHPLQKADQETLEWLSQYELPIHILLTKADKLTRNHGMQALQKTKQACKCYHGVSLQLFSATKDIGVDEAREYVMQCFL